MTELLDAAHLFEASAKLGTAAEYFRTRSHNPETSVAECLRWTGHFLVNVDLSSPARATVSGELAVQAAEVRPLFYATLQNLQDDLKEAGLDSPERLRTFLCRLYALLESGGATGGNKFQTSEEKAAATILGHLANGLLLQLDCNGMMPRQDTISGSPV